LVNLFGRTLVPGTVDKHEEFTKELIQGQISEGAEADFLILSSNPLEDEQDDLTVRIEGVVAKGEIAVQKHENKDKKNRDHKNGKNHNKNINVDDEDS
jgi:adenine deaminase